MSTISKEAREAGISEATNEDFPYGHFVQLLLDTQKSENEKVFSDQYEKDTVEMVSANKVITELRAACAEKDKALRGVLGNEDRTIGRDYLIHVLHFEACETALSSHGESTLAELKELRRINNEEYTESGWLRAKELEAELSALRARSESAERERNYFKLILERFMNDCPCDNDGQGCPCERLSGEALSLIEAAQPPQQGDKAP